MLALIDVIRPDLIITGINSLGMGGLEFLKSARMSPIARDIPIIISTVHGECMEEALVLGAREFLLKPFEIEELMDAVQGAVIYSPWAYMENFTGRARRREYWMFALFNLIFLIVAMILDNVLGTTFKAGGGAYLATLPYGWIYLLYSLAMIVPGLAVWVRRLHDVGKSGWWLLIGFIPLTGAIWLFVLACTDGDPRSNMFGPSPKEPVAPLPGI